MSKGADFGLYSTAYQWSVITGNGINENSNQLCLTKARVPLQFTVGAKLPNLTAIVSWVPDASADKFVEPESGIIEELGQIVQPAFWQETHDAKVGKKLPLVKPPTYIVQCTADEYIDK